MLSDEEIKAMDYFKVKIKNKIPLYEETYVDEKPYRINILQLETNFTEEQANKAEILLNLIEKQSKEIEELHKEINQRIKLKLENERCADEDFIHKDKIKAKIKEYYEYDKRMQNKPDWHTIKYYEAKALEKLLEE